ncbi:hypothetical protein CBS101457_006502 [Exobasidium rhododendri]|nr:hypothetical protein CBS101457_006502 [Exobasidium rhododendri]
MLWKRDPPPPVAETKNSMLGKVKSIFASKKDRKSSKQSSASPTADTSAPDRTSTAKGESSVGCFNGQCPLSTRPARKDGSKEDEQEQSRPSSSRSDDPPSSQGLAKDSASGKLRKKMARLFGKPHTKTSPTESRPTYGSNKAGKTLAQLFAEDPFPSSIPSDKYSPPPSPHSTDGDPLPPSSLSTDETGVPSEPSSTTSDPSHNSSTPTIKADKPNPPPVRPRKKSVGTFVPSLTPIEEQSLSARKKAVKLISKPFGKIGQRTSKYFGKNDHSSATRKEEKLNGRKEKQVIESPEGSPQSSSSGVSSPVDSQSRYESGSSGSFGTSSSGSSELENPGPSPTLDERMQEARAAFAEELKQYKDYRYYLLNPDKIDWIDYDKRKFIIKLKAEQEERKVRLKTLADKVEQIFRESEAVKEKKAVKPRWNVPPLKQRPSSTGSRTIAPTA